MLGLAEKGTKPTVGDYIVTRTWGEKAAVECKKYGTGNVVITTKASKFTKIPAESEYKLSDDSCFVHYTANETVNGVEWKMTPDAKEGCLLVITAATSARSRSTGQSMQLSMRVLRKTLDQQATPW